ncbi:MAG: dephospho-CoA kinase [Bacteroidales bacterium]|nr:dephospho-CoA kinase [Bacteroidales bacterium]
MKKHTTILITGGIGAGKSEVSRYLMSTGIPVYDSDSRAKELYNIEPQLIESLEEAFGTVLYEADGSFDRKHLAEIVFSSEANLKICESIVHPAVLRDFISWRAGQPAGIVAMESAIALSKPLFDGSYDLSIYVDAEENLRVRRTCARDGSNPEAVRRRIDNQPDFRSKADYVIMNNGNLEELHRSIGAIVLPLMIQEINN